MNVLKSGYKPLALAVSLGLAACGGGSGGDIAGIGGTGITSEGTITAFGSIFVNGVEFELPSANIIVDGQVASESDLKLGMVVRVSGTFDDNNGLRATAASVEYDDELQGPISDIEVNADGTLKTLTILGVKVVVEDGNVVFADGLSFDTLAVDQVVEVSGFVNADGSLQATRLENKGSTGGATEVELKGTISGLDTLAGTFQLHGQTVAFLNADLSDLSGNLVNGLFVEVKGTLQADGTILAEEIEQEDRDFDDQDKVSLEGLITDFIGQADFKINGRQPVDARGARFEPANLVLADGVKVEVEGPVVNGVLKAIEVKARGGEIKIEAPVSDLSEINEGILSLRVFGRDVRVALDTATRLEDDISDSDNLRREDFLANLRLDDFLEIRGVQADAGSNLITATRIEKDDADDTILQAPLQAFDASAQTLTLLGVVVPTDGNTEFEGLDDSDFSSAAEFFAQAQVGALVKIKDERDNGAPDGTADEVEFEDD